MARRKQSKYFKIPRVHRSSVELGSQRQSEMLHCSLKVIRQFWLSLLDHRKMRKELIQFLWIEHWPLLCLTASILRQSSLNYRTVARLSGNGVNPESRYSPLARVTCARSHKIRLVDSAK